jgi:hypothetical protein
VVLAGDDQSNRQIGRNGSFDVAAAAEQDLLDRAPWPPEVDMILSAMEVAWSSAGAGSLSAARTAAASANFTARAPGATNGSASISPLPAAIAEAPGASTLVGGSDEDFFMPERRCAQRLPYRTRAHLKLYADRSDAAPAVLYTRDADHRGMGFITPNLLPLGYGGWISLCAPNGEIVRVECTIYRCRKTVRGWYEGALNFHRDVWQLG